MTYYITTPIYYVNDKPHIGHAYTSLACDVLARFKRLSGEQVYFLTGTDEHGQKVEKSAEKAGMEPQAFCDMNAAHFRELAKLMNFSNNDFIRTTEPRHKKGAQAFWDVLKAKGYIYEDKYAGWYAVRDEAYYQESELVDGKAPTGAEVEWVEEPSYFFKLSAFTEPLLEYYEKHPEFVYPESRFNEVKRFVEGGLKDLSISRTTFKWGVPVPGDEKHVMYVWLDALANYLTAIGYPEMDQRWPANVHVVGKDILRFHAVYWPAFLMAADLPLPEQIVAHGWWTNEGQKISKSLGNVIDPVKLVEEFGLDQTRYFLMREVPFGNDGNFSRERMISVINSELANTIGNLAQRTLGFIAKNCDGVLPDVKFPENKPFQPVRVFSNYQDQVAGYRFNTALEYINALAVAKNQRIDKAAPWQMKKEGNMEGMNIELYILVDGIRQIAILLQPYMPEAAAKMLMLVGYDALDAQTGVPFTELSTPLKPGTKLPAPTPIFPRFQESDKVA